jgi:hypothetical protein
MALLRTRPRGPLLVGLLLATLAFGIFLRAQLPRPGVTRANYGRIQDGMTLEEVEALLGQSITADDANLNSLSLREALDLFKQSPWPLSNMCPARYWIEEDLVIRVWFYDGRVEDQDFYSRPSARSRFWEHLRRLLGL